MVNQALLEFVAWRAEGDSHFLGSALAVFSEGERIDRDELARRLGCSPDVLRRLALCRRPRPQDETYTDDVRRIAAWAAVDADHLMNIVRFADAAAALQAANTGTITGMLLAARETVDDDLTDDSSNDHLTAPERGEPDA